MADSQSPKKDYGTPEFRLYGDIREITRTVFPGQSPTNDTIPPKRTA